jgi:hypothetical protein
MFSLANNIFRFYISNLGYFGLKLIAHSNVATPINGLILLVGCHTKY